MISGLSSSIASAIQSASIHANAWRVDASGKEAEREAGATDERAGNSRSSELSAAEQRQVEEMKSTDRAVRAHEAAHMAAGGSLVTSGASYSYETGPDGQRYAVAGEVGIDTSKGRTPEETLIRADQIRAAALAPADPSAQDRAVAAAAAQMAAEARAEIARARMDEGKANEAGETGENEAASSAKPRAPASGGESGSRAASFGQAIERSLNPAAGQAVNIYA
ncbi:MAG: hypothetical protein LBK55_04485 [Azoarcus sp.]|jgi:hypothetical protein|nr:hypothetical protein [Azoarcus sp.]